MIASMRKGIALIIALLACVSLAGCAATKTLHCDNCGKEVKVSADSSMNEDWVLFCDDCQKELGLDNMVEVRP